jgi:LuxR family transcriptional regulator, maltose regulon positive regulatory protein
MQTVDTLIRTKLRLPFTRPGLVPRLRLQEQIAEGLRCPLTLVVAPAGFGKTTLVATSLAKCAMPVAWLSLDQSDNQAGQFLTYLTAALQGANQRIGGEAAQLLQGMPPAPSEAVLTSLINDLDGAGVEMLLVLDDYQFIRSPAVQADVAFLLDHCPQAFHLLMATRSDPALPLARLRARSQMVELRAADLRFTADEAAQFLNEVMGLHLDRGSVAVLEERTEGWVAGLQMAALSLHDRTDVQRFIEGFSGTNRHILDYLLEEILASQPAEIQHFLLNTAILERLTAPLCDALLANDPKPEPGDGDQGPDTGSSALRPSASILEYLERENLFVVALDDERVWFRYHHLFADLLRARLQQSKSATVPLLHRRASAWLEQKGLITDAIQHLLAAREIGRAAELIERYGPARWQENDLTVMQMADSLPPELLTERPKIGAYQAWLLILQGNIEKALPLLHDLARRTQEAVPNSEQGWIRTFTQLALIFLCPPARAAELGPFPAEEVLDEIPAAELVLRDAADILYGMALGRRGELERAAQFSLKSIRRQKSPYGKQAIPTLVTFLATIYLFQGRMHEAAALCRQYLGPIQEKGIRISTAGNLDVVLGDVLYEWNSLEEAESHIRNGLQENEPWGNIMTDAFGLLALAHVLQAKGDNPGALQIVDKFESRLQQPTRPSEFNEDFRTLRVRLQLAGGDLRRAAEWAETIRFNEDFQLYPEYYRLTLVRIRLAQGKYAEAEAIMTTMAPTAPAGNLIIRQIESNLLLATAMAGQQRWPEAFELVKTCLALAEPEGCIRVFLDIGDAARELLADYLRSPDAQHSLFAQKLLDAFSPAGRPSSPAVQQAGLVEPLSGRELEVLQLMALGKTNQEIARQLFISPGTVKAHTASIYRKLDVANRTEAVAHARQLDLLS